MLLDTHRPFRVYTTLLRKCLHLVTHRTIATKRDLYYRDVGLFRNQATVDNALEDIAASLGVRRGCLHVVAASRGLIAGAVVYVLRSGERVTVSEHDSEQGAMLPPPETIAEILPPPLETFVLIVEKEATFRSLLKLGFHHRFGPCILMTGRGYPDVATRAFVKRLAGVMRRQTIEPKLGPYLAKDGSDDSIAALPPSSAPLPNASPASRLPLYVLTDNDPHGIDIFLCYSRGSRSMAFDAASLACPDVQWLGLRTDAWYGPIAASWSPHPSGQLSRGVTEGDWEPDGVRQARSLPLTPQDRRKAVSCLAQVGLRQDPDLAVCRRDLSRMLFLQRKCEIQLFEDEALVQWLVRRLDLGLRPCGP
ncbi:hypothetical protein CXG81DRAFT_23384 [Caulochytrium protostelioides]|uniref:DNA topoisomerase (ATP-hydrolyzing) n=1 Tax=Caulochytrium protostelioides TaxID=1555241 RepID=A0A4P9XFH1_9FUNG|nr:hypothetical protein CXG81DRAFT_23384 [Caulochytrium protostelioides]|eukprot:RKP03971.1 hypothetical protein CXG81DRAFT_23384 [Caulochytrium protostelioides]